jgi:hypothetical protein
MDEYIYINKSYSNPLDIQNSKHRLVKGYATVQTRDKDGEIVNLDGITDAMIGYMKRGGLINLEHSNIVVGKTVHWDIGNHPDTNEKCIEITVAVDTDEDLPRLNSIWRNIQKGLFKGFSIAGDATEVVKESINDTLTKVYKKLQIAEISIVADPANQLALFTEKSFAKSNVLLKTPLEEVAREVALAEKGTLEEVGGIYYVYKATKKENKIKRVMEEFGAGELKTPSGEVVTDRDQALAIAYSEYEKSVRDMLVGGLSDGMDIEDIAKLHDVSVEHIQGQLDKGIKVEMEHSDDEGVAQKISLDHLVENANYYDELEKMEASFEKSEDTVGYLMAEFRVHDWEEIQKFVKEEDLHEKGRELNPHVTIAYGFKPDTNEKELFSRLKGQDYITAIMDDIGIFENEEYDVLYIQVQSNDLFRLHSKFANELGKQDFEYNPHMTIAYLQKGKGSEYLEGMNGRILLDKVFHRELDSDKVSYGINDGDLKYFDLEKSEDKKSLCLKEKVKELPQEEEIEKAEGAVTSGSSGYYNVAPDRHKKLLEKCELLKASLR